MSRPVVVLFRRVSPNLLAAAQRLAPAAAAMGADVSTPEDVLRLALEVGIVALGCAAPPKPDAHAAHIVQATLEARDSAGAAPLRENPS